MADGFAEVVLAKGQTVVAPKSGRVKRAADPAYLSAVKDMQVHYFDPEWFVKSRQEFNRAAEELGMKFKTRTVYAADKDGNATDRKLTELQGFIPEVESAEAE